MGASEDMLGIMPPIIIAGAATSMTKSIFGSGDEKKQRVVYRTRVKKVYAKRKKVHAKRVRNIKKTVKKYL
jgi:hypothetical protein